MKPFLTVLCGVSALIGFTLVAYLTIYIMIGTWCAADRVFRGTDFVVCVKS